MDNNYEIGGITMSKNPTQRSLLKIETGNLIDENYGNPAIDNIVSNVAKLSDIPMIVEIRTAQFVHDYTNTFENMFVSKTTAETMPFELLPEGDETSDALAKEFLDKSHNVSEKPSYDELESAFSGVLSQKTYENIPEFLNKFNESGLSSLNPVSHHIFMKHPIEQDGKYIGEILIDPTHSRTNQYHTGRSFKICEYKLTNDL